MVEILIKVIPLDLAATISPVLFSLVVYSLSSREKPKTKALSILLGALLVGIAITVGGFFTGGATSGKHAQSTTTGIIDLVLGALFIVYGFKQLFSSQRKAKRDQKRGAATWKWFLAGILISIFNDSFFLIFASAKEVGAGDLGSWSKLAFLIINVFFFTLPITLPLSIDYIFPKTAGNILGKISRFLSNYGGLIIMILFLIFGIYFAIKGLGILY